MKSRVENASQHQIHIAIEQLSLDDRTALRRQAKKHMMGTSFATPEELIQEAFLRCLDGRRLWPINVMFVIFLMNCVKSIADGDRQGYQTKNILSFSQIEPKVKRACLMNYEAVIASPEENYLYRERHEALYERLQNLRRYFKDNVLALNIINGWAKELTPSEIMATYKMSQPEYYSARKKVVGRINHIRLFD